MLSKESIILEIKKDWGEKPQSEICISVLNYVTSSSVLLTHITFGSVRRVVGYDFSDKDIFEALQYLCGSKIDLLEIGFEFFEDKESVPVEISAKEVQQANATGSLLHPEKGELMTDFEEKVYMFFRASESSQKIN